MLAHAAFGLMNSTPFLGGEVDRARSAELLRAATLAALRDRRRSAVTRPHAGRCGQRHVSAQAVDNAVDRPSTCG